MGNSNISSNYHEKYLLTLTSAKSVLGLHSPLAICFPEANTGGRIFATLGRHKLSLATLCFSVIELWLGKKHKQTKTMSCTLTFPGSFPPLLCGVLRSRAFRRRSHSGMGLDLMPLPHPSEHLWPEDRSEQLGMKQFLQHFHWQRVLCMRDRSNRQAGLWQGYAGQL